VTRSKHALALVFVLILAGCQTAATAQPTPQPTPSPSGTTPPVIFPGPTDGPEKFVVDLDVAGVESRLGPVFAGDPLPAQGVVVCVGTEQVRLYVFGSVRDRMDAAAKIDPTDASNMGTAMVRWNGRPRFWQRDRMLVLYLGEDAATDTLLRSLLGEPFATGQGPATPAGRQLQITGALLAV